MRLFAFAAGILIAGSASAVTESNLGVSTARSSAVPYYGWNVEANVQFISMADETDAMLGSGLFYQLTDYFEAGLQTLLSTNEGGNSTARLAARQYFTDGRTKLFFQPAIGYNLHRKEEDSARVIETGSLSADVGVKHRLFKDLHIGGTSGLELVDRGRYYREPEAQRQYVLTPRVAFVTNVDF